MKEQAIYSVEGFANYSQLKRYIAAETKAKIVSEFHAADNSLIVIVVEGDGWDLSGISVEGLRLAGYNAKELHKC